MYLVVSESVQELVGQVDAEPGLLPAWRLGLPGDRVQPLPGHRSLLVGNELWLGGDVVVGDDLLQLPRHLVIVDVGSGPDGVLHAEEDDEPVVPELTGLQDGPDKVEAVVAPSLGVGGAELYVLVTVDVDLFAPCHLTEKKLGSKQF